VGARGFGKGGGAELRGKMMMGQLSLVGAEEKFQEGISVREFQKLGRGEACGRKMLSWGGCYLSKQQKE